MTSAQPCRRYIAAEDRICGATPTRLYIQGPLCTEHGTPEPQRTPAPALTGQQDDRPRMPDADAAAFIRTWNAARRRAQETHRGGRRRRTDSTSLPEVA